MRQHPTHCYYLLSGYMLYAIIMNFTQGVKVLKCVSSLLRIYYDAAGFTVWTYVLDDQLQIKHWFIQSISRKKPSVNPA